MPEALALAAGDEGVERADAEGQRLVDAGAARARAASRWPGRRRRRREPSGGPPSTGPAEAVEDPAEQRRRRPAPAAACRWRARARRRGRRTRVPSGMQVSRSRPTATTSASSGAVAGVDLHEVADGGGEAVDGQGQAHGAGDRAGDLGPGGPRRSPAGSLPPVPGGGADQRRANFPQPLRPAYSKDTLGDDFRDVRANVFGPGETRQLADFRRSGTVRPSRGSRAEQVRRKMANTLLGVEPATQTYGPVQLARADVTREAARTGPAAGTKTGQKYHRAGPKVSRRPYENAKSLK